MRRRNDDLPYSFSPSANTASQTPWSSRKPSWWSLFVRNHLRNRRRLTLVSFLFVLSILAILWRSYEVHVEFALHSRGWVREHVETVRPLSAQCFGEKEISSLQPSFVDLSPGLALRYDGDCYGFASTIPKHPLPGMNLPTSVPVHLYWRSDLRPFGEREILAVQSILVTQPSHFHVNLWTSSPEQLLTKSKALSDLVDRYADRIAIHTANFQVLTSGTPLEGSSRLQSILDRKAYFDGDLIRLLLLWNFGGLWIDMDYIITRRLDVLLENEWVQQWDCYDKPYQPLNGAMMHFHQHSPYICEMLHVIATDPPPRHLSTDWGSLVYHKVWRRLVANSIKPFKILPFCFTDARSCRLDTRLPDPFEQDPPYPESRWNQLQQRLDSIFAIHLHNQWDKTFPKGGWMDRYVVSKVQEQTR